MAESWFELIELSINDGGNYQIDITMLVAIFVSLIDVDSTDVALKI